MSTPETAPIVLSETEFYPSGRGQQLEGMGIKPVQYHSPVNDVEFPALDFHLLTLNLGEPGELNRIQARRTQKTQMMRGGMTLTPVGQPRHWFWNHSTDILLLQLQPSLISQVAIAAEIDMSQIELVDRFGIYDPQLEFIGKSLLAEMESNGLAGQLYAESLINLLVVHLLRQHSALGQFSREQQSRTLPKATDSLAPSRLKQVLEYIHDNLGHSLSLLELSSVANLSPSHFTRVFRQETGQSPHQYLIQARIDQAKHLLRSGDDLSIGSIAHQVGFADQSHFTRHFKRIVGVTPNVILQESRNVLNCNRNIQDGESKPLP